MGKRRIGFAASALLATWGLLASGCGYRWVHAAEALPAGTAVYLETLVDDGGEPGVERLVSESLRRELLRRADVVLIEAPRADAWQARGRVAGLDTVGRSFSAAVLALEYEVDLRIELTVRPPGGSALRLDPGALRATEIYLSSAEVEVGRRNRMEALRRVSTRVAEATVDSWLREARALAASQAHALQSERVESREVGRESAPEREEAR